MRLFLVFLSRFPGTRDGFRNQFGVVHPAAWADFGVQEDRCRFLDRRCMLRWRRWCRGSPGGGHLLANAARFGDHVPAKEGVRSWAAWPVPGSRDWLSFDFCRAVVLAIRRMRSPAVPVSRA